VPLAEVATRRLKFLEHPGDRNHYFCYAFFTKGRYNNKKHTQWEDGDSPSISSQGLLITFISFKHKPNYTDTKLNNCNIYSEQLFIIQFKVAHLVPEFPVFVYTEHLLLYSPVSMLMTNLDR
jgi:hypothetical protein